VVLLDVGGVMLLPHHQSISAGLGGLAGDLDGPRAARAHYLGVVAIDTEPPDPTRGYTEAFAEAIGVPALDLPGAVAALGTLWALPSIDVWRQIVDGTVKGLRLLARQGYRLGIISNSDGTVESQLRLHKLCQIGEGAGVRVEVIADSFAIGHAKPNP
jgi:FMN phosphatase YigB (HAD superfamily)